MTTKWILSACILALGAVPVAASDVRLDAYRNPPSDAFHNFNQLYLDGVKAGLLSYNAWMKRHGGQPAFCLPENVAITTGQAEAIMLSSASKRSAKGDMLVALLLLSGLQETYPCEKTGG